MVLLLNVTPIQVSNIAPPRTTLRMLSSILSFIIDPHAYEMMIDFSTGTKPSSIEVPNASHAASHLQSATVEEHHQVLKQEPPQRARNDQEHTLSLAQPSIAESSTSAATRQSPRKRSAPSSSSTATSSTSAPARKKRRSNKKTKDYPYPYHTANTRAIYRIKKEFTWFHMTGSESILEPPPIPEGVVLNLGDIFLYHDSLSKSNDAMPRAWHAVANNTGELYHWEPAVPFSTTRLIDGECYVLSIHWVSKVPSWVLNTSVQKMNRFMVGKFAQAGPSNPSSGSESTQNQNRKKKRTEKQTPRVR